MISPLGMWEHLRNGGANEGSVSLWRLPEMEDCHSRKLARTVRSAVELQIVNVLDTPKPLDKKDPPLAFEMFNSV
jgi:hypothetical protein